ncbi:hypothetical protein GCM10028794_02560 [Silanimonas algicola]
MRTALAAALTAALALSSAGVASQVAATTATPQADVAAASMPVPVWDRDSGELQAVLWIDTSTLPDQTLGSTPLGKRWSGRDRGLSVGLSASVEPRYGLLCGSEGAGADASTLDDRCLVTQLARPKSLANGQLGAQVGTRIGRSEWMGFGAIRRGGTDGLLPGTSLSLANPELAALAGLPGVGFEQNDFGIVGDLKIGEQGWIRLGGSVARARLMPANSMLLGGVAPRWNSRTLSVGGGYGAIGGEVVGRVVRVPGERESYGTLGLGLTWRTPWAGRLTVGAQNLMSTGDNPVVQRGQGDEREEGRVPYVRYQQDL